MMCLIDSRIEVLFKLRPISTWRAVRSQSVSKGNVLYFTYTSESEGCTVCLNQPTYFMIWFLTKTDSSLLELWRKKVPSLVSSNWKLFQWSICWNHKFILEYLRSIGWIFFHIKLLSVMKQLVYFGRHKFLLFLISCFLWEAYKWITPVSTLS